MNELYERVTKVWYDLMKPEECQKVIETMPKLLRVTVVSQNRYSTLSTVRIIYNYDPSTSIDIWLRLFEAKADRLGLTDVTKMEQLPSYLPVNMAQWLLSSPNLMEWESAKKALTETFGIPTAQLKQICRNKLEKLQQGNLPSRQFKALFESIILELPKDTNLPTDLLRSIYLKVMHPRLRAIVLPNLNCRIYPIKYLLFV
ncbi:hypothetical protein G6F28_011559 [Rhizopus arrhizus]|nr:hypothetical protein G6F30_011604 [Rhizopus arrhizus]KAG0980819.1 hypothetical protein G6F28_011559 [Rhizopus arrhizus]KAG1059345.1 hypothetical protein G6F41_013495 [Rhizopus arrhizus]KAG1083107.1 hypothetical protein G6F39_013462 [Rhizopus arrhizus]KAG1272643.1 hypothetical protein G6F66_013319 [Rhizopus arrhizus]